MAHTRIASSERDNWVIRSCGQKKKKISFSFLLNKTCAEDGEKVRRKKKNRENSFKA